jgi:hypothetical protein
MPTNVKSFYFEEVLVGTRILFVEGFRRQKI